MTYSDESSKTFVGRFLTQEEFPQWLAAQNLGSKPAWEGSIHHTWRPTPRSWKGYSSLRGIFTWYRTQKGWPEGVGPHHWIAPGPDGQWGVWIGTHPRRDGIAVRGYNHRRIHVETVWDGDEKPFGVPQLEILRTIMWAYHDRLGIPVRHTPDPVQYEGGWFLHRDRASKSCPGTKNTPELIFEKEDGMVTVDHVAAPDQIDAAQEHLIAQGHMSEKRPVRASTAMGDSLGFLLMSRIAARAQQKNEELAKRVAELEDRVDALEGGTQEVVDADELAERIIDEITTRLQNPD